MKLNPECIRNVLLVIEENTDLMTQFRYPVDPINELINSYTSEEVLYHVKQCELSGFLTKVTWINSVMACIVFDLSPTGHEFIANIRSDTNWKKVKELAKSVGSFSLDALMKIATSVITNTINESQKV